MIKLSKYIYIHWLFVMILIIGYINRQLEFFLLSYLIMTVHELSHLVAAKCLGLSISHIVFYPFGLNLRLKNTMLYSISDEIILYLAGPLSNVIMALISLPFAVKNECFYQFYCMNIGLFFVNIIPVTPLDGGMVIKKLLNYRFGFDRGNIYMKAISLVMLIILILLSSYLVYTNHFNPSLYIYIAFIFGNVIMSKEKYNKNLLKELLYSREKKNGKIAYNARIIGCDENSSMIEAAKKFNQSDNYFVFFTNENKKVVKILSEEEIICKLLTDNHEKI